MVKSEPRLRRGGLPASWHPLTNESYALAGSCLVQHWQPCLVLPSRRCRHPAHQHTTVHKGMHRSLGARESRSRWQGVVGGVRGGQGRVGRGRGLAPGGASTTSGWWLAERPASWPSPAGWILSHWSSSTLVASYEKTHLCRSSVVFYFKKVRKEPTEISSPLNMLVQCAMLGLE